MKVNYVPAEVKSYTTKEEFTASFYDGTTEVRVKIWGEYFQIQYYRGMTDQWESYWKPISMDTLNAALEAYNKIKQGK